MTNPRTTRRYAVVALFAVWTLVCGGLAWAMRSAVQLERIEQRDRQIKVQERSLTLALERLDALVAPVLYRETNRPYEHFRSTYMAAKAVSTVDGSEVNVILPSPLRNFTGPSWLLLHFQASEKQGWNSPELPRGDPWDDLVHTPDVVDSDRQAALENWLTLLESRFTPFMLLELLERSEMRTNESSPTRDPSLAGRPSAWPTPTPLGSYRDEEAFLRRSTRLLAMQRENNPVDQCEPEMVALANLESTGSRMPSDRKGEQCVNLSRTAMKPLWLDISRNGTLHLAMVRSVTVETSRFCTLQGVLIDWEKLRHILENDIHDLYPGANIVPVIDQHGLSHEARLSMMQTIPARLATGALPIVKSPELSGSLWAGLCVAWVATVLALTAITYGVLKYVTLVTNRMEFVAAVTHELRTPLTSMQLYTDLLARNGSDDPVRRRRYIEQLQGESTRLARLVENVLVYSRMGAPRPRLDWQDVRPGDLLDAVAASTTAGCATAGKNIVKEDLCPPDLRLNTDTQFVEQILASLVDNACKYSADADDAQVWLRARETADGSVSFEVEDAGSGILPRDRRNIFEPFRRSSAAQRSTAEGLGLGLALSRYWADCLGGKLVIKQATKGGSQFSCFELRLPRFVRRST